MLVIVCPLWGAFLLRGRKIRRAPRPCPSPGRHLCLPVFSGAAGGIAHAFGPPPVTPASGSRPFWRLPWSFVLLRPDGRRALPFASSMRPFSPPSGKRELCGSGTKKRRALVSDINSFGGKHAERSFLRFPDCAFTAAVLDPPVWPLNKGAVPFRAHPGGTGRPTSDPELPRKPGRPSPGSSARSLPLSGKPALRVAPPAPKFENIRNFRVWAGADRYGPACCTVPAIFRKRRTRARPPFRPWDQNRDRP